VGTAVVLALRELGAEVIPIPTPRVSVAWGSQLGDWQQVAGSASVLTPLVAALRSSEAVVNCAGIANPGAVASPALYGANALVPILLWEACRRADVARFVHVSSAAVQGDREILDESEAVSPLTPYATSKAAGERLLRASNPQGVTIIRPTSVHGHDRPLTARLARFARSRFSSVAGSGDRTSPQVLVQNVGSAVARLASCADVPPPIVLQPAEGQTVRSVLRVLGLGREPRHVPEYLARAVLAATGVASSDPRLASARRRLQILWFGQGQSAGWLASQGFTPPAGADGWVTLAAALAERGSLDSTRRHARSKPW
jgi:nucleoside-diphosphate-sugar epimerase